MALIIHPHLPAAALCDEGVPGEINRRILGPVLTVGGFFVYIL